MARSRSCSATDRPLKRAALAATLLLSLSSCGRGGSGTGDVVPPVADDDAAYAALPTPAAAPGSRVTGMPTRPPPASVASAAPLPAPVDPAGEAAGVALDPNAPLPAPVDGGAAGDPPSGGASSIDAAPAVAVLTQYLASLGSGALVRAQGMWSTTPNDSAVLRLARAGTFNVSLGAALIDAGGQVSVPVEVRGNAEDGSPGHVQATYTLRSNPQDGWRIVTATTRDVSP